MDDAPRDELISLVRAARALVDMHVAAGGVGVPTGRLDWPAPGPVAQAAVSIAAAPRPVTPAAPMTTGDGPTRLSVLAERVAACTKCVLHEQRKQTVFARGNPEAELCFVGEGPGADEDEQGAPFVGKAGQLLDRMIVAMGYRPEDVYVCNVVKCRPPNNRKPEPDEMAACLPYLSEQLDVVAPRVIVALGGTAAQGLIGAPVSITRIRGEWRLYRTSIPMMPTFHPAYLLRNPAAKREVWADLQAVLHKLGRPLPPRGGRE